MTCQGIWHPKVLPKKGLYRAVSCESEKTVFNPATLGTQRLQTEIFSWYPFSIKISLNLLTQRYAINFSTFFFSKNPQNSVKTFKFFTPSEIYSQELADIASQVVIAYRSIFRHLLTCACTQMPYNWVSEENKFKILLFLPLI